jgi:hypothetical protein
MGALADRLSTRFLVVTVAPMALLLGFVGFLAAAGAPARSPSISRAVTVLDGLSLRQIAALVAALFIASLVTHPLQLPLIQLVEGYWWRLPGGPAVANRATERFRAERKFVRAELTRAPLPRETPWARKQAADIAKQRQHWLPAAEHMLPTRLGNTLRVGEVRAGARYGLELDVAMPRLVAILSPACLDELREYRNQLDAAVRVCVASGLATIFGVGMLVWHGSWLYLPIVTYLLCWTSYAAAVAAARSFCTSLAAAVDLHHLQLFDALQLDRPADLEAEIKRNGLLTKIFRGSAIHSEDKQRLRYPARRGDDESSSSQSTQ